LLFVTILHFLKGLRPSCGLVLSRRNRKLYKQSKNWEASCHFRVCKCLCYCSNFSL